jgi:hypothetical protein
MQVKNNYASGDLVWVKIPNMEDFLPHYHIVSNHGGYVGLAIISYKIGIGKENPIKYNYACKLPVKFESFYGFNVRDEWIIRKVK